MVEIAEISVIIAAISVSLAAIYYMLNVRYTQRNMKTTLETRQAQLFTQIYNRWNSRDLIRAYGLVRYRYPRPLTVDAILDEHGLLADPEAYADYMTLHSFFEGLGVLVKKGMVDVGWVEDLFARRIIWHWEHFESAFKDARKRLNDPGQYSNIEYLYNEMTRRERERTNHT